MLWPETTRRDAAGQLVIGDVAVPELVGRFGTPLYVFDERTLRHRARRFRDAFSTAYPSSRVVYAGKAYLSPAVVAILSEEGLGLDVVSGGELHAALVAGVPPREITFHGNNKSEAELRDAIDGGIGCVVIDNDWELSLLAKLVAGRDTPLSVLLRLNPGIDVETHENIRTGNLDSKFGLPVATGQAASAVERVLAMPGLDLAGYHAHIGSQLFDWAAYGATIDALLRFAAEMGKRHGLVPRIISPGGGFGIAYEEGDEEAPVEAWAAAAAEALTTGCRRYGLPRPELIVEPGRAIVGPAGVALYRVGAIKDIPGLRRYVSVDGGMADNIRPSLYGAKYSVALASRLARDEETVTVAGKFCESGDILIRDARLPALVPGDVLAVPAAGAYCLAMASNYNLAPRPAAVLVNNGYARLIRRRETYDDLLATEVFPGLSQPDRESAALAPPLET